MDSPPAAALPAITVVSDGDAAHDVAVALTDRLPGQTGRLDDLEAAPALLPSPGEQATAAPVLVILTATSDMVEATTAVARLAQTIAQGGTRARIWIALLLPVDADVVTALDTALDDLAAPVVDAVVLVASGPPAASAASLTAWLELRHDAPSAAFGDLRDGEGNLCRFATVRAVTVTGAPTESATAESGLAESPAGAMRAEGHEPARRAERLLNEHLEAVCQAAESDPQVDPRPLISEHVARLEADLAGATSAELSALVAASVAASLPPDPAALRAAELREARAEAALAAENSRTGMTARIGRRKRLAPLTEEVAQATEERRRAASSYAQNVAAAAFRQEVASRLAAAASAKSQAERSHRSEVQAAATFAWLVSAKAQARRIQLPVSIDPAVLSPAWGGAAPAIRRHVLVPAGTAIGETSWIAPNDPAEVIVTEFADLDRPLAAAFLLGLPRTVVS